VFEDVKKFCPAAGPHNENVAAVVLVALAAEIAEAAKRIQGTSNDRFRNAE
jgi:hypothetical protein